MIGSRINIYKLKFRVESILLYELMFWTEGFKINKLIHHHNQNVWFNIQIAQMMCLNTVNKVPSSYSFVGTRSSLYLSFSFYFPIPLQIRNSNSRKFQLRGEKKFANYRVWATKLKFVFLLHWVMVKRGTV